MAKPIWITGDPDNRRPNKWSSTVFEGNAIKKVAMALQFISWMEYRLSLQDCDAEIPVPLEKDGRRTKLEAKEIVCEDGKFMQSSS